MQIKRYEAATLQEVMMKIKNDLGPDAVVLSTNRIRKGKGAFFEVTAARDSVTPRCAGGGSRADEGPGRSEGPSRFPEAPGRRDELASLRREIAELKSLIVGIQDSRTLQGEFAELKDTLEELLSTAGFRLEGRPDGPWMNIYRRLIAGGIPKRSAWKILQRAREETGGRMEHIEGGLLATAAVVRRAIPVTAAEGKKRRVQVLIGPTGAGKTTTTAKLAAHYTLEKRKKVALVTMDTYRIAAAEQLRVYADIMAIPLAVASEKAALKRAMDRFADFDVVLVDTPGKGRSDVAYMENLQEALQGELAPEIHLLVNLTSSRESIKDAAARFGAFSYDNLILTKADECRSFGFLYDVIENIGRPLSFVTNGQAVPQDIERADPAKLASLIVRGNLYG